MNTVEYIFSLFSFLAFVLAVLFFLKKKGDKVANKLLGVYVFLFGYNIFYNVLYWSKKLFTEEYVTMLFTNMWVWVLYGPILFFYVRRVLYASKFSWKDTVHFIPFLLVFINYFQIYGMTASEKLSHLQNGRIIEGILYFNPNQVYGIIALMLLYFALIMYHFKKQTTSFKRGKWLSWISFSFLGYVLSFSMFFVLRDFGVLKPNHDYMIVGSMLLFISMLAYFGFLQPEIFEGDSAVAIISKPKYKSSGLSDRFSEELKHNLEEIMQTERPYLNNEFRLDDLAEQLNISRHHCSQVINEHFDANFFNYINHHRIEEAKKLLQNNPDLTINEVVYASGFNNRVSFYTAFKKFMGITPKMYLESLKTEV